METSVLRKCFVSDSEFGVGDVLRPASEPARVFRTGEYGQLPRHVACTGRREVNLTWCKPAALYSHAPHNDVSVDAPHIRRRSHNIII